MALELTGDLLVHLSDNLVARRWSRARSEFEVDVLRAVDFAPPHCQHELLREPVAAASWQVQADSVQDFMQVFDSVVIKYEANVFGGQTPNLLIGAGAAELGSIAQSATSRQV